MDPAAPPACRLIRGGSSHRNIHWTHEQLTQTSVDYGVSEESVLKGLYANRELKDDGLNNPIIGVRAGLLPLDRVSKSAGARMGKRKQLDDDKTLCVLRALHRI